MSKSERNFISEMVICVDKNQTTTVIMINENPSHVNFKHTHIHVKH